MARIRRVRWRGTRGLAQLATAALVGQACAVLAVEAAAAEPAWEEAYVAAVLADEPVSYWRLGGPEMTDEMGRYDGDVVGDVVLGADPILGTDGSALFVESSAAEPVGMEVPIGSERGEGTLSSNDLTLEFWIDGWGWGNPIIRNGAFGEGYRVNNQPDCPTCLVASVGYEETTELDYVQAEYAHGGSAHIAVTLDEEEFRIYVDGELADSSTRSGATVAYEPTDALHFGHRLPGARLDEVAIYDHALSPERVRHHATLGGGAIKLGLAFDVIQSLFGSRRNSGYAADPVNVASGNFTETFSDVDFGTRSAIRWTRTYNSLDPSVGDVGSRWSHAFSEMVTEVSDGSVLLRDADGRRVTFQAEQGGWSRPEEVAGDLVRRGDDSFAIEWFAGGASEFDVAGRLESRSMPDGEVISITRAGASDDLLAVMSSWGPSLTFTYGDGFISGVETSDGREVTYGYDGSFLDSVVDERGLTTTFEQDSSGRVIREVDPAGVLVVENQYDPFDRVVVQEAGSGAVTTFAYDDVDLSTTVHDSVTDTTLVYRYDETGRLSEIEDPFGQTVQRANYDPNGNPQSRVSRRGTEFTATYNDRDQPLTVTDPGTGTTSYTYDALGRVESVNVPNGEPGGATTIYGYEGSERLPSTVTDELGGATMYDVVDGLVLSVMDPDGVVTSYVYTADRLVESVTQTAGGVSLVTSYEYDSQGRVIETISPEGLETVRGYNSAGLLSHEIAPDGGRTDYTYDAAGRVATVTGPELSPTDSRRPVTTLVYNAAGLVAEERRPGPGASGLPEAVTSYEYDGAGQVLEVTHPDGTVTTNGYGPLGRLLSSSDAGGRVSDYQYDADGSVTVVANQAGEQTETVYDALGRVEATVDGEGRTSSTVYDAAGRVEATTSPATGTTSYEYDGLGRTVAVVDARGGETVTTYTPGGRVATVTTPDGVVTTYTYDTAGRVTAIERSGGRVTSFEYDKDGRTVRVTSPEGDVTTTSYDAGGRVAAMSDPAEVTMARTWTAHGQLLTEAVSGQGTVGYRHDLAGNLAEVADALGNATTYTHDAMGRRLTRTNDDGKTETWTYHPDGQVATYTDPLVDGQGARTTTYTYDPDTGRLAQVEDPSGRVTDLSYNAAGQMIERAAEMPDGAGGTVTDTATFDYSATTGLLSAMSGPSGTTSYAYTGAGDPWLIARSDGRNLAFNYDSAGRRTAVTHPDGNTYHYAYDAAGRLATVTPAYNLTDTFTGTSGGLDTTKWTLGGTGSAAITGNRARLQTTTAVNSISNVRSKLPSPTDVEIAATIDLNDQTQGTGTVTIRARGTGLGWVQMEATHGGTTVVVKQNSWGTVTTLGSLNVPPGTAAKRVRLRVEGDNIKAKIWNSDAWVEPGWGLDVNAPGTNWAGNIDLQLKRTTGTPVAFLDNVTIADLDNPPAPVAEAAYDLDDRLTELGIPDGQRTWSYSEGQLAGYGQDLPGTAQDLNTTLGYNTSGQLETDTTNGQSTTYGYDSAGQLLSADGPGAADQIWTYDNLGRWATSARPTGTFAYDYDDANQLTSADCTAGPCEDVTYSYDRAGRRLSQIAEGASTTFGYDPSGRLITTAVDTGAQTNTTTRTLDPAGALIALTHADGTTTKTNRLTWDTTQPIRSLVETTAGTASTQHLAAAGQWVATNTGVATTATAATFTEDLLALPADPYGLADSADMGHGYRGELHVGELIHLRNRDYDPATGQFLTKDPLDGLDGTPVVANPYHYANNDPVNLTDPLGLQPSDWALMGGSEEKVMAAVEKLTSQPGLLEGNSLGVCGVLQFQGPPIPPYVVPIAVEGELCAIYDGDHIAFLGFVAAGSGTPYAAASVGPLVSNADHYRQLTGWTACAGAGGGYIGGAGVELCLGLTGNGGLSGIWSLWGGAGKAIGVDVHVVFGRVEEIYSINLPCIDPPSVGVYINIGPIDIGGRANPPSVWCD